MDITIKAYARAELRAFSKNIAKELAEVDVNDPAALRVLLNSYTQYNAAVDEYLNGDEALELEAAASALNTGFTDRTTPIDHDTVTKGVGELRASGQGVVDHA